MATPSTSKKIQRVQQSGVTRRVGQRRPMGFPAAVAAIIVVGLVLVWFARDARINVGGDRPRPNLDVWNQAYGFYDCEDYLPNAPAPAEEADITTRGNGLIFVAPLSEDSSGDNATMAKFFENTGIKVSDDSVTLADGTEYKAGDECGTGKDKTTKTVIKLFSWPPQASDKTEPEVLTDDFGSVRFEQDKAIYALALVPESVNQIDLPPSVDNLANPDASVPATSAPGATTTIAPADSSTTVVGDTTVAPDTSAPDTTLAPASTSAPTTTEG